jgi:hypothetical protein
MFYFRRASIAQAAHTRPISGDLGRIENAGKGRPTTVALSIVRQ